jgi:hypothetical protein
MPVEKVIPTEPAAGQPGEPVHLENFRFSRVLRTRDRLVRSSQHFIHSPLTSDPSAGSSLRAPRDS